MDRFEAALRREPAVPAPPVESQPVLVARIRSEIEAAGPITFARFMERSLYEPDLGYYQTPAERPGRAGDFLTAPDLHPIFGAALARQLDEIHARLGRPDRFVVREDGAGSGSLAMAILRAVTGQGRLGSVAGSPDLARALRYVPVETNRHRRRDLVERLTAAGFGEIVADGGPTGPVADGVVIANELLDALPVHRVVGRDDGLRELYVGLDGERFVEIEAEPSTPALAGRLAADGVVLADGVQGEICLAMEPWLSGAVAWLGRGAVLVFDYGDVAAGLYRPGRPTGTLLAYAGHRAHDDWSVGVGHQDLTAHVDFTALEAAGRVLGLEPLGRTSQAAFLVGTGLEELVEAIRSDPATTAEEWLALRSAVGRLLDPRALGGFRVAVFGRGMASEPPLRGLAQPVGP